MKVISCQDQKHDNAYLSFGISPSTHKKFIPFLLVMSELVRSLSFQVFEVMLK